MSRRRGLPEDGQQLAMFDGEVVRSLPSIRDIRPLPIKSSSAVLSGSIGQEVRRPVLDQYVFHLEGYSVEPFADPILARHLGTYDDHREYQVMDRDPAVSDAWRHVESSVLNHGFEIQVGRSRSPAAKVLERFAETLWDRLDQGERQAYIMRCMDAAKWGWQPLQVLPDTKAKFEGADVWLPSKIVEKPAHHFRWTSPADGKSERALLFLPSLGQRIRKIEGADLEYGWIVPRYGSVNIPYGDHYVYQRAWILWEALRVVRKAYFQGLPRNFGMLKFGPRSLGVGQALVGSTVDWDQVAADIKNLLDLYHNANVVVEVGGYAVEVLSDLNFISAGEQAIKGIETAIRLLVTGETLTSDPGDRGTQALGRVHERVRTDYGLAKVASTVEPATTELFRRYATLNFGEIDPVDLPTLQSRIRLQVSISDVVACYNMGMPIRSGRLAELLGAGMASVIATSEDDPETVLKKPEGVDFASLLFPNQNGDGADTESSGDNNMPSGTAMAAQEKAALTLLLARQRIDRDRGLTVMDALNRAADSSSVGNLNSGLSAATADSTKDASVAMADYVGSLLDSFLERRGVLADPKDSPPPSA